jgi:hypothetical protein
LAPFLGIPGFFCYGTDALLIHSQFQMYTLPLGKFAGLIVSDAEYSSFENYTISTKTINKTLKNTF